jgi:hypothetical protein
MITTATVSEFRENLSKFLDLLKDGHSVELTDGRTKKALLRIKSVKEGYIDWDKHIAKMKKMAGKGYFIADEADRKKLRKGIDKRLHERVSYG